MLVLDNFIPPEYQEQIEQLSVWHEDVGDWEVPGLAYAGNASAVNHFSAQVKSHVLS